MRLQDNCNGVQKPTSMIELKEYFSFCLLMVLKFMKSYFNDKYGFLFLFKLPLGSPFKWSNTKIIFNINSDNSPGLV